MGCNGQGGRRGDRLMKKPLLTPWLHRKRVEIIRPYIKGKVLDIGCGPADISKFEGIKDYTGIELSQNQVNILKEKNSEYHFVQMNLDIDEFPDKGLKFDTIVMIAVIEHLENPDNILSQISSLLNIGGKFIITTPSPRGDDIHQIGSRFGLTSKEAVNDHSFIYGKKELKNLLWRNGLQMYIYQKFIFGLNQLVVCKKRDL